jgi:hypothetical protein
MDRKRAKAVMVPYEGMHRIQFGFRPSAAPVPSIVEVIE